MRVKELWAFIMERHLIYERRKAGLHKPWTEDPILQRYRFCNVYRELDTVTGYIRLNWREPHDTDPQLWFAMLVARTYNLPLTLGAMGYPVPYNPKRIKRVTAKITQAGGNTFNAAYMIRADPMGAGGTKTDYLIEKVFGPAWARREEFDLRNITTCEGLHGKLTTLYGVGSFMAAQVVADTKFGYWLRRAPDWWTFAAPGPGSERGLNWVCERAPNTPWKKGAWFAQLQILQKEINPLIQKEKMPRLSAQDLQNCMCEVWKWARFKYNLGGPPKQLYPGV